MNTIGKTLLGTAALALGLATLPGAARADWDDHHHRHYRGGYVVVEPQYYAPPPVYYAPGVDSNYFFYDGLYWDFHNDAWYSSAWYNGPWEIVDPVYVPTYVLWVPIRFYRRPPAYFRGVRPGNPPRWSEHWGRDWQARHNAIFGGRAGPVPAPAPLPHYQRQYTRENYPRGAQQGALHSQYYGYQRRDAVAQQRPGRQQRHRDEGQREQRR